MDRHPAWSYLTVALVMVLVGGCITTVGESPMPATPSAQATLPPASGDGQATPAPVGPAPSAVTGHLQLGDPSAPENGVLGALGGSIAINRPGDPLDGVTLEVPAGAYATDTSFTIEARPITGHDFGPLISPVSNLITVENGGGYAELPVSLRIPATIPADAVAGAWFYDATTGSLEGVPLVARDETSLTVLTRHFSSIFASIAEAGLPDVIDSGFVPSLDAWEIPNSGSYPEPDGYCEGSSISAMWYFLEQHRAAGASHLYGTYDNNGGTHTPGFWKDDASAIRLATTVQHKTDWEGLAHGFFSEREWIAGALAYDAFRYSMAVTGEPQLVFVHSETARHAMVVYKVDSGHLWISDPNFPGEERSTTFDWATKTLAPYVGSETFPTILYAAKSAIVPWSDLAADWSQFEDGTIGDDVFPAVDLFVTHAGEHEPLVSGYETDQASIRVIQSSSDLSYTVLYQYRGDQESADVYTVRLAMGENVVGFLVESMHRIGELRWVQFKRYTIVRVAPSPSPDVGGIWQLVSGPDQIGEQQPISGIGWTTEGGPGSLQSTVSSSGEDFTAAFSWYAPAALEPGQPLDVGGTVGIVKKPDYCDNNYVCDLAAELYAGLLVMTPPPNPQQGPQVIASANARGQRWQTTTPETVPDYDPAYGPTMVLQVGIQHADANIWYQYVYEWSGSR
jgi:hypothetical protein